ncbi:hypothetical protein [Parapedobacter sp. 10938]|uniref:hypothetical protein n=1 Tax=Parapedobacter flavus TaxID=3110225 RepID=UPI002DBECB44|nr:hypothetical protein [Parapedobacter sp. 10938]MEC3881806.1 hypothetical protein [Parapedobacter sp. 10938]
MDAIAITGICIAAALFIGATAIAWKAGKITEPVLYSSLAVTAAFIILSILRTGDQSIVLTAAHTVMAAVFIILAKNNLTVVYKLYIKPRPPMKETTEQSKFDEYSYAIHNLQGKVANGLALSQEEKLLLEYYIDWVRDYKQKQTVAKQKTMANKH